VWSDYTIYDLEMITLVRVGMAPIVEKIVENRLTRFGQVEKRPIDYIVISKENKSNGG